jgi:hypothetical protein
MRNDALSPGANVSETSGALPKKSCVVRVESVGSAAPARSRNRIPG